MDITLRIVLLIISILFLVFVLLRIRRGQYLLKYSLLWIFLSLIGVVSSIFPHWLYLAAKTLGFSVPSNFVYFALIGFLLLSNLAFCGVLSRQETAIKSLVQEISILRKSVDENLSQETDILQDAAIAQTRVLDGLTKEKK